MSSWATDGFLLCCVPRRAKHLHCQTRRKCFKCLLQRVGEEWIALFLRSLEEPNKAGDFLVWEVVTGSLEGNEICRSEPVNFACQMAIACFIPEGQNCKSLLA